ncbi:hypothetical protein CRD60_00960 [Bifidobacterium aemilianum]|uniref:Phage portal protein n=1 Tax=Bifidobacterium aemilianum TaxID=2493120 RepID=A0A366K9R3_9BIFI|nr:phage portal protein [Bifidobacterium aemilianum]RBP98466.1 hypothetical protein CRD60_00960 [Bifidobacterium aemilianum]
MSDVLMGDYRRSGLGFNLPEHIQGIDEDTYDLLAQLVVIWNRKRSRNLLRSAYVDGKHRLDHVGFSIPPSMRDMEEIVGWPDKAVSAHAERCMFDGFVSRTMPQDPFDLSGLMADNRFDVEIPQAIRSSMIHSVSFLSVTRGDERSGEPPVLVMPHSAEWSSALWDFRRRALKGAMVVNDVDSYGTPTMITVFTPEEIVTCRKGTGWYVESATRHGLGRVPVESLTYRPEIDRPFGRSVVSRAVMSITDDAMRTVLRTEVSAEFYSAPQLFLMGADPESFTDDQGNPIPMWEMVLGRINAVSKDDEGDVPSLQQIGQQSVQPHIMQLQQLAARFAGETNVPVSSLGIVAENSQSAEAMMAAQKDLVVDCSAANRSYGSALKRIAQDMVMLRDGLAEPTDELRSLEVKWRNPAMPSVIDAGDAMIKLISAFPWMADTVVALEQVGFNDEQISRLLSERRRNEAKDQLDTVLGRLSGGQGDDDQSGRDQAEQGPAEDRGPGDSGDEKPAEGPQGNGPGMAA